MPYSLDYFTTYGSCGKIYIRCNYDSHNTPPCKVHDSNPYCPSTHEHGSSYPHDGCASHQHDHDVPHHYKVRYTLFKDGEKRESKNASDDELVCFSYTCCANYRIGAKIANPHGKDYVLYTPVIIPVENDQFTPEHSHTRSLKGLLTLPDYGPGHLKVQFCKGGLKKLKNEEEDQVPIYSKLLTDLDFEPCFSKNTLERITRYNPDYSALYDLYRVKTTISDDDLLELGNELEGLEYVEYCIIEGEVAGIVPEHSSPPASPYGYTAPWGEASSPFSVTPNFTPRQYFLDADWGMNVRAVWNRNITGGKNINIFIMDDGVFRNHEDLANVTIVTNDEIFLGPNTQGNDHGTASAGVLVASGNNGLGVTGIAFNGRCLSYGRHPDDLDAIIARAEPGDVFSISLGAPVHGIGFPTIYDPGWANGLRRLVQAGVVVVTGAANDGINLRNNARFSARLNSLGDSGVILAAAINPRTRRREWWSNHNWNRMLNAWGSEVATTGHTTIFNPGPITRRYGYYSGTSAATPQIAGVVALIQSYAKSRYHTIFNAHDIYNILSQTGYTDAAQDLIGRRPNALAAINYVDALLGTQTAPPPPPSPPPSSYPQWDPRLQYLAPTRVSWNGRNWQALWWSQGTAPGTRDRNNQYPWRLLP